jgi:periplasmic divalent cation tolerance protein
VSPDPGILQVQTTVAREEDARIVVNALVAERLAACGQVLGPIESVYWWRGTVQAQREWLVLLKTTAARYPGLESRLRTIHPYEEPEIVAVPVVAGSAGYLAWVAAEARAKE